MKVLITGIGYIGKFLVEQYSREGHQVIGLYRDKPPTLVQDVQDKVLLIQHSLKEPPLQVPEADLIIHTAAVSSASRIPPTLEEYITSNVDSTLNILRFAQEKPTKLMIYLSSVSVYGMVKEPVLEETTPLNQPDVYGLTKHLGETILCQSAASFPIVSIRLPGVVGPPKNITYTAWIARVVLQALRNQEINIFNPRSLFNNIVHLVDLKKFIDHVVRCGTKGFESVNLAATEPLPLKQLVALIISRMGSSSKVCIRNSGAASFSICTEKAERVFNYLAPSTRESILRLCADYCPQTLQVAD